MAEKNTTTTAAKKGNVFADSVFGAIIFSQPTGKKETRWRGGDPITQIRLAQAKLELGKGTGTFTDGYSVVALVHDDPAQDPVIQGKGPSYKKGNGEVYQPFISHNTPEAEDQWNAFLDMLATEGLDWYNKNGGASIAQMRSNGLKIDRERLGLKPAATVPEAKTA